jgi:hypothetical protein
LERNPASSGRCQRRGKVACILFFYGFQELPIDQPSLDHASSNGAPVLSRASSLVRAPTFPIVMPATGPWSPPDVMISLNVGTMKSLALKIYQALTKQGATLFLVLFHVFLVIFYILYSLIFQLIQWFSCAGFSVWVCTDMKAGESFRTDIARNAANCKAFLMLINEAWYLVAIKCYN